MNTYFGQITANFLVESRDRKNAFVVFRYIKCVFLEQLSSSVEFHYTHAYAKLTRYTKIFNDKTAKRLSYNVHAPALRVKYNLL